MVQRLVQHQNPEAVETPLLLLAALREIDDTVELVYFGESRWRLGAVRRTDERQRRGQLILAQQESLDEVKRNPRNIWLGQLLLQGFAQIEEYIGRDPAGVVLVNPGPQEYRCTILEDFRERDAAWRRDQGETVFQERLTAASSEERQRVADLNFKQYLATDGREHYRREMRNRVSFGAGGVTRADEVFAGHGLILPPGFGEG